MKDLHIIVVTIKVMYLILTPEYSGNLMMMKFINLETCLREYIIDQIIFLCTDTRKKIQCKVQIMYYWWFLLELVL